MKKKCILLIIFLVILMLVSNDNDKTFSINGIKYAVSVDGVSENSFPDKGSYEVSVECMNATGKWNYELWQAEMSNITGNVSCAISFTSKSIKYLNSYIKDELTGTTQGVGQVVNENGYRYEGVNPNNYIRFNNEIWRIIGVFDATAHGQTDEYLTKIIRADTMGGITWNGKTASYNNDWATSTLYNLLNGAYYNAEDGTDSGYCYIYVFPPFTKITGTCDYRVGGIKDEYRQMVKNVTWYLGGYSSPQVTTDNMYSYERSTSSTYYRSGNSKTATGYVGLMYVSDYGYSVLSSSCSRTTLLSDYGTSGCGGSSWLNKDNYEWTITHSTNYSFLSYYLDYKGVLSNSYTSITNYTEHEVINSHDFRPTLYLDSSIYILSGDGSSFNPYVIGMDSE